MSGQGVFQEHLSLNEIYAEILNNDVVLLAVDSTSEDNGTA